MLSRERADERERMVAEQLADRGIRDPRVLAAVRAVPRHAFVHPSTQADAYQDGPLPIGQGQTISQPYIVGLMTEALELGPEDVVLEIGTGSGYQAAVLSRLAREVYTIEIVDSLASRAERTLKELGCSNVHVLHGDGYHGLPEQAPFDAIVLTAAPDHVPQGLVDQLAPGGRMVLPVGEWDQDLVRVRRGEGGVEEERLLPVRFVPMTGTSHGA